MVTAWLAVAPRCPTLSGDLRGTDHAGQQCACLPSSLRSYLKGTSERRLEDAAGQSASIPHDVFIVCAGHVELPTQTSAESIRLRVTTKILGDGPQDRPELPVGGCEVFNSLNKALSNRVTEAESRLLSADVNGGLEPNTVTRCASSSRGSERRFRRRYVMRGRPKAVDCLHGQWRPESVALDQFGSAASPPRPDRLLKLPEVGNELSWRSRPEGELLIQTCQAQRNGERARTVGGTCTAAL